MWCYHCFKDRYSKQLMHCEESGERRQKTKSMIQRYKTNDSRSGCKLKEYQREPCDEYEMIVATNTHKNVREKWTKGKAGKESEWPAGFGGSCSPDGPDVCRWSFVLRRPDFRLLPGTMPSALLRHLFSTSFFLDTAVRIGHINSVFAVFVVACFSSFSSRLGWRVEHSK